MFKFPSSLAGAKDPPRLWRRLDNQLPSGRGSAAPLSGWQKEVEQLLSWRAPSAQP
jgi:hypothetical protein